MFSFLVGHYCPQHILISYSRRHCICNESLQTIINMEAKEPLLQYDKVSEAATESDVNFCEGDAYTGRVSTTLTSCRLC
jgi:hypothetical protein